MQRLLAIDCDSRELCFVLATATGDQVTLEAAEVVSLKTSAEGSPLSPEEIGKQLHESLARHKRTGTKFLTLVDRNAIELSEMTVPPAADAELPELVLNQLSMESPNSANDSVVDFTPSPGDTTQPRRVTTATLSQAEHTRVKAICAAAGFKPDRMLVRPYETASLFLSQSIVRSAHSLLVNVIADDVDLVVVDQERTLFFRTVRLPGSVGDEPAEQRLLDEIRRTLLVAPQNAEVGQVIDAVYIFGSGPNYERLVQQISKDCATKVELLDPCAGFSSSTQWSQPSSGRLAPLLGALIGEARSQHPIDFLNPRRAPKPPNRRRQLIIGATAAAVLALSVGYYISDLFAAADAQNQRLKDEFNRLDSLVKKSTEKRKVADAIDDWNANSVVWLDELRELSVKFPPGQDIVLQQLTMAPARGGRANVSFQGLARESKVVPRMEATLRDPRHDIQTPRVEERLHDKIYAWSFVTSMSLSPAKLDYKELIEQKDGVGEKEISKSPEAAPAEKPSKTNKSRVNSKKNPAKEQASAQEAGKTGQTRDDAKSTLDSNTEVAKEQ